MGHLLLFVLHLNLMIFLLCSRVRCLTLGVSGYTWCLVPYRLESGTEKIDSGDLTNSETFRWRNHQ